MGKSILKNIPSTPTAKLNMQILPMTNIWSKTIEFISTKILFLLAIVLGGKTHNDLTY